MVAKPFKFIITLPILLIMVYFDIIKLPIAIFFFIPFYGIIYIVQWWCKDKHGMQAAKQLMIVSLILGIISYCAFVWDYDLMV